MCLVSNLYTVQSHDTGLCHAWCAWCLWASEEVGTLQEATDIARGRDKKPCALYTPEQVSVVPYTNNTDTQN